MKEEQKKDIKSLSFEQLLEFMLKNGEQKFRAKQVYDWLWKKNISDFEQMSNISSSVKTLLSDNFILNKFVVTYEQKSNDGTFKVGISLWDNSLIEGVLIPAEERSTACISTQVGCAMKCSFCATAKLGFSRNLSTSEIFDQVVLLNKYSLDLFKRGLTNIVVMGMGEPLLNYTNVKEAITLLTSIDGMNMSPSRITLSTVGIPKMIKQLADDQIKYNLAISLHAASDSIRNEIIPSNINHPLSEISDSLDYFYKKTNNRITIEYLLLKNVNDSINDAENLAKFCRRFPVKVNLIEFNKVESIPFYPSDSVQIEKFKVYLESKNMIVNIRRSKGKDIDAACGQLAGKKR